MTEKIWFDGSIVDRESCHIPVMSISSQFGLSVFEGLRVYRSEKRKKQFLFRLKDHLLRLRRSMERLGLPFTVSDVEIEIGIKQVLLANNIFGDASVRLIIVQDEDGSWSKIQPEGRLVIAPLAKKPTIISAQKPVNLSVSSWRRISDAAMPSSIKVGSNYTNSRLGLLDVKSRSADLPLFLNSKGFVSESSGANVMCVIDNKLVTPTLDDEILDGITRNTLLVVAKEMGIIAGERHIEIDELKAADEVFLCGTSAEIMPVKRIDEATFSYSSNGITATLFSEYLKLVRGGQSSHKEWLTLL